MSADQADTNAPEVRLTDTTITYLEEKIEAAVSRGLVDGVKRLLSDDDLAQKTAERFWGVGLELLKQQAKVKAGGWTLEVVTTAAKKGFWILLMVGAIYAIGGWSAVKEFGAVLAKIITTG